MTDETNDSNVFKFGALTGGKDEAAEDKVPQNDYVVIDIDENEFDINGFLIFTPHHLAIMKDEGEGAVPALVLPIGRVKVACLASVIDVADTDTLPF